jgi:hypothetical protein
MISFVNTLERSAIKNIRRCKADSRKLATSTLTAEVVDTLIKILQIFNAKRYDVLMAKRVVWQMLEELYLCELVNFPKRREDLISEIDKCKEDELSHLLGER